VVPRRTLVIVAAALVIALLGTVIGVAMANSGDGTGGSGASGGGQSQSGTGTASPSASPSGSATPSASPSADDAKSPSSTDGSLTDEDSGDSGDSDSADDSSADDSSASAGTGAAAVPAGYTRVTNTAYHFAIAMPTGWHKTGTTTGGSGVIYSADGHYPRVQVDYTSEPGKDAAATWRANEPYVAADSDGYQLVSIASVDYRGYRTAADWIFLRTESDGTKTKVLNRGFVVDDTHAYAIMVSIPAADWDSPAAVTMRATFFSSFASVG